MVGLVGAHLFLMRLQGLSPLEDVAEEKPLTPENSHPFFPHHVLKELVVFPVFLIVLIAVTVLFPIELGERANPLVTPEGIKPEWYFLSTPQLLKYFPKLLGILVSIVPMVLLLIWPWLDRTPAREPRKRPWSIGIGIAALILAIFFGVLGHYSEQNVTWQGSTYHVDMYGIPHLLEPKAPFNGTDGNADPKSTDNSREKDNGD